MIFSYRLARDGTTTFPFVSAGIKDLYGVSAEAMALDATLTVPLIHPKDMEKMWLAILESAHPNAPQLEALRRRVEGRSKVLS